MSTELELHDLRECGDVREQAKAYLELSLCFLSNVTHGNDAEVRCNSTCGAALGGEEAADRWTVFPQRQCPITTSTILEHRKS